MISLRTDRNCLLTAVTRSGKTTLLLAIGSLLRAAIGTERVKAINPRREPLMSAWCAETGVEEIVPSLDARGRCPPDLSARLRSWYATGNITLVVDELQMVAKVQDPDPIWRYWLSAGNGRGCAVKATTTVATQIPGEALTQAEECITFRQHDLTTLRKLAQRNEALPDMVRDLAPYEWVFHRLGEAPIRMAPLSWPH